MSWAGKKNGELMKVAHGQFAVFVTAGQNLQYQQNLAYADVGFLVLVAINNRIKTLALLMPQVIEALQSITAGQVVEIEAKTD